MKKRPEELKVVPKDFEKCEPKNKTVPKYGQAKNKTVPEYDEPKTKTRPKHAKPKKKRSPELDLEVSWETIQAMGAGGGVDEADGGADAAEAEAKDGGDGTAEGGAEAAGEVEGGADGTDNNSDDADGAPCHRREFNPKGGPYNMF